MGLVESDGGGRERPSGGCRQQGRVLARGAGAWMMGELAWRMLAGERELTWRTPAGGRTRWGIPQDGDRLAEGVTKG
jgi:hypothetical protein